MSRDADLLEALLADTTTKVRNLTIDLLERRRSLSNFVLLMDRFFEIADTVNKPLADLGNPEQSIACQPGCNHCCAKTKVVTQPAFAVYALFFAKGGQDGSVYRYAVNNLQSGGGCEFLRDEVCSIYSARPLVCRLYHSNNVNECLKFNFLRSVRSVTVGDVAAAAGLVEGLKELSIDCEDVFLSDALRLLCTSSGVFEDWLAGGAVFAPCRVDVSLSKSD
jgi:Fe-S-cluster containining protein